MGGVNRVALLSAVAAILILASSNCASATVGGAGMANATSTVRVPTVVLQSGNAGSSTISVVPNAASASVTAGLTFYESSNAPASCSPPATDTSLSAPGSSGSFTVSPYTYVPVTVTNSQTSATQASIQVVLNIPFVNYKTYLRSDVGNVRFYSSPSLSSGNELYAWMESFAGSSAASSATSSAVWVALPTSIPASSSTTIYMIFGPTSTTFDGVYWGEASDLSPVHGQYDNGAKVFLYYNNGGTSSGFNVVNGGSLGLASMADPYGVTTNVLVLAGSGSVASSSETVAWYTQGVAGNNFIIDGWVDILATSDSSTYNANALFAARGSGSTTTTNYILGEGWTGAESALAYESGTTNTVLNSGGSRGIGWVWATSSLVGSSLTDAIYTAPSYAGGTSLASAASTNANIGTSNTFVGIANWAGATGSSFFYQWKVRVYPPNGVMPSSSFGALVANPASACLISPQFSVSSTLFAANWVADIWASATASGSLGVAITIVSSSGAVVSTLASGATTGTIATVKAEVKSAVAASAGTVASTDYVEMVFASLATGPLAVTLYWGAGQLTNFQPPTSYNYVLAISNPTTSSWTVDLATMTSLTSNLARLSNVTIWFAGPFSKQIVVLGGSLSQSTGTAATLGGMSTIDLAVVASANAMPSSLNAPSSIAFSLKVLSSSSASYAQYTIRLAVG